MKLTAWNLKQLYDQMEINLASCGTNHERIMVKALCGKEIREKAIELSKQRKLTPMELAIAQQFGYEND